MSTYNDTTKETVAYVVFDIGKNVHAMAAYADQELRPIVKPEYILADQTGFERAGVVLDELLTGGKYDRIVVGHEPTGVYHEAWARALCDRYANALRPESRPYIDYQFLNPYQTKQDRKRILGRNRKTDFLDLAAIARCLADGAGSPAYLPRAQDLVFQQWAASYYQGVRARRRLTIQLLSAFDRVWPGALVDVGRFKQAHPKLAVPQPLVLSKPLERKLVRALIQQCPDPHAVRRMSESELVAFLRQHTGRGSAIAARRVLNCVNRSLLPPPDIAAVLAHQLQLDFEQYLALEARLNAWMAEAERLVPGSAAAVLTTIPGISPCIPYDPTRHP